jgi:MFS family permease
MQRELRTTLEDLQWVMNGYSLALAGTVVLAGRLGDALGRKRLLPLFRSGRFLGASVTSFVLAFVAWAALFFMPLAFQQLRGHSTVVAGALLLPCTVLWSLVSLQSGPVAERIGRRPAMAAGLGLAAAGSVCSASLERHSLCRSWRSRSSDSESGSPSLR